MIERLKLFQEKAVAYLDKVRIKMNNKYDGVALVDFCGTLVSVQTADLFVHFTIRKNLIKRIRYYILYLYQKVSIKTKTNFLKLTLDKRLFLKFLKGYTKQQIEISSQKFAKMIFDKYLYGETISSLKKLDNKNIIIISAGYKSYIDEFCKLIDINIDKVYASDFLYENDIFTGRIDRTCYGDDKVKILEENNELEGYSKSQIYVFTDSSSDLPIVDLGKNVYCINPDSKLLKLAKINDWIIIK
ncbi:HAD family hydrolase [Acholeplasma laidlawii]|uniref:HAD family hydrolase n=1 Tax=Acholeplasma laidlawii TaxID=2148 RepID=UPI00253F7CDB|nr:HAD-IB family phosphatase [Acholeplasma laidlawii]